MDEIKQHHTTPRAVKRLLNKLRFYAMLIRALPGAEALRSRNDLDRIIVAFGVLEGKEQKQHADLRSIIPKESPNLSTQQRQDVESLQNELMTHEAVFKFLQSSVDTRGSKKNT